MYYLHDISKDYKYTSKTLEALTAITGTHVNTLRYWLNNPKVANIKGFELFKTSYIKGKQGGKRS
jgi:hypothetical protein